jgi:hypothetical protein
MTNTPTRLAQIRARADAATPGPWKDSGTNRGKLIVSESDPWPVLELYGPDSEHRVVARFRDLEFMADARTDIPWLLERVEALERERDEYLAAVLSIANAGWVTCEAEDTVRRFQSRALIAIEEVESWSENDAALAAGPGGA